MKLDVAMNSIKSLDELSMKLAKDKLDGLTKPLNSLGKLEKIIIRLAGILRTPEPEISKRAVVIMCADNGVVEEGVSSCPKEVTSTVTQNFLKGITGVNIFANYAKTDLVICDIGVDDELSNLTGILHKKIRYGTNNIAYGPAMTRDEAIRAIEIGIDIVEDLYKDGYRLICTGEMGIGNTTTSSAITSVLTSSNPSEVTGRGSGLSDIAHQNKAEIVKKAIDINRPYLDSIDILSKLGGFDIAGLTGCFIGSAAMGIPCVIDGFISGVAALLAISICPQAKDYVFTSHFSKEPGAVKLFEAIEMEPLLTLEMCLGEGSGAVLSLVIFDAALEAYNKMGTFEDAKIEKYTPQI